MIQIMLLREGKQGLVCMGGLELWGLRPRVEGRDFSFILEIWRLLKQTQ